jgi:lysophospholipase L1-like esterase
MIYLLIGIILVACGAIAVLLYQRALARISSSDPTVWEKAIRAFEGEDQRIPPPPHPIVFTGSSSIRFWNTLADDMAPLAVLNRGFGGSQMGQVTFYADRIVLPYDPLAVVFYAGENDIAFGNLTAEQAPGAFQQFCEKIHAALPEVPIYFISIKPPKRRQQFWPIMEEANALIRTYCASDKRLHYIDIVPSMHDASGNVKGNIFRWDGIHLNAQGYTLWTACVRPILLAAFPPAENRPASTL